MTIVVAVKVADGIALAADSALTLVKDGRINHIYNNAEKIFQLHGSLPLAAVVYGTSNVGSLSVRFLMAEVRHHIEGDWITHDKGPFDPEHYSVEQIAHKVAIEFCRFAREAKIERLDEKFTAVIAGYSSRSFGPEVWEVTVWGPKTFDRKPVVPESTTGWFAYAQSAAVIRMFDGLERNLEKALEKLVPQDRHADLKALTKEQRHAAVHRFMPLPDAIALARFLVETTIGFSLFTKAAPTVGGLVDIATVSRHEGFRWEARKGYHGV